MQRGGAIPAKVTAPTQLRAAVMTAGPSGMSMAQSPASASPQPGATAASANPTAVAAAVQQQQQMAQAMTQQQQAIKEVKKSWIELMNDIARCSKHVRAGTAQTLDTKEKEMLQIRLMHLNSSVEGLVAFFDSYLQHAAIELTTNEYAGALFEHVNALSRIQAELASARQEIFGDVS
eukprot:TRINITY_DN3074_c0_g1_i1.p1 TRINITY_DN3074_c0_g1~~TRINITY_DN3074_c0_g1_i1.p1  ORF type:complete len:177 (-),score=36.90 TRINITY_DN3074_c0_g1_i1:242-772(-)